MAETEQTKVCPLCAETIKAAARVCPYCRKYQRRWACVTVNEISTIASIVFLLGTVFLFERVCYPQRDFGLDKDKLQVQNLNFAIQRDRFATNAVVVGIVTNSSEHSWDVETLEIRYLDANGKLAAMDNLYDDFTILPHGDHAFRLALEHRSSIPQYPGYKMKVVSALDPRRSLWLLKLRMP